MGADTIVRSRCFVGLVELRSHGRFALVLHDVTGAACTSALKLNKPLLCTAETDDKMRAFAEKVFASETKDESIRDEFSMFDVAEDCPILQSEIVHHLHADDDTEKR